VTPQEPAPSPPGTWLEQHTARAPEALRRRVAEYAGQVSGSATTPDSLATAGQLALQRALEHPDDRSAALDLLAADALVTLALLAQAEQDPQRLAAFAQDILHALRPGS
jgi:hypothetical protein